jgi:hypothetical protein
MSVGGSGGVGVGLGSGSVFNALGLVHKVGCILFALGTAPAIWIMEGAMS